METPKCPRPCTAGSRQAPFQLHGQSVETADVPSVRHLLLPPVSSSEGKGESGGGGRARVWPGQGRARRAPATPGGVDGGLLTIALAWVARGGARGGGCPGSGVRGSGYRKPWGERLDRKEPPAPSWPGGGEGRWAERRPSPSVGGLAADAWGPAAGPAGGAAFRPLLLGLAPRALTLAFPRSGARPPAP